MASETVECCREWESTTDAFGHPVMRYAWRTLGAASLPMDDGPVHCTWCGARFTLTEAGEVEVGPSEAKLLAALQGMIGVVGGCPKVCLPRVGCPANSPAPPPGEACRVDNDNGWQACWLLHYGLASTYAEAAALWERMGEAAKSDE